MEEFENIYNIARNKVKKEFEEFKQSMLNRPQIDIINNAYKVYMFCEFHSFWCMYNDEIDEYFSADYLRTFMRNNKIKIMEYINNNNILQHMYWFFDELDELTPPTYDNISWAFAEVLDGRM